MIADLIFITIYSIGALCGGILLRSDNRVFVKRIGALVIAASVIFFVTDQVETIAQSIQLFKMAGSDSLAKLAAAMIAPKTISFLVTLVGLLGVILWDKFLTKSR